MCMSDVRKMRFSMWLYLENDTDTDFVSNAFSARVANKNTLCISILIISS